MARQFQLIVTAIIFVVISLRVTKWFQHPNILMSGDLRIPLNIDAYYKNFLHTWNEIDFGSPSFYLPRVLDPLYILLVVFRLLGLELSVAEMIAIIVVHLVALVIIYQYFKYLLNDWVATIIATIYVITSPFLIVDREINAIMNINVLIITLTPTIFFIKGILSKNIRYSVVAGLLFNLTYATSPNYRPSIFCLIMILITCVYFFIKNRVSITIASKSMSVTLILHGMKKYLIYILVFLFAIVVSSAWYFYIVYENFNVIEASLSKVNIDYTLTDYYLNKINIFDAMRLIAKWGLFSDSLGKPFVPYRDFYTTNFIGIILTITPPVIALVTPLMFPRRTTVYFGFIALLSVWLASALYPLTELYITIVRVIPFSMIVRESYWWGFFTVLCYGYLLGFFASSICKYTRRDFLKLAVLFLLEAVFLSSTWPLITGDVSRNWLDLRIKGNCVPNQHLYINNYILSQIYWTLFIPQRAAYIKYNFSGCIFEAGNPYPLIYSKPIVTGIGIDYVSSPSSVWINQLYELIYEAPVNDSTILKLLAVFGIRYVVYENSIIEGTIRPLNPEKLVSLGLKIINGDRDRYGGFILYENPYAYQKIYATNKIVLMNKMDVKSLYELLSSYELLTTEPIVFTNHKIEIDLNLPRIFKWVQISPTEYIIHVKSDNPFILVLLQSFNSNWKIYVNGREYPEYKHFIANVYANAWLIDEIGELTIVIKYKIQDIVSYAAMIFSILVPVLFVVFLYRRHINIFFKRILYALNLSRQKTFNNI